MKTTDYKVGDTVMLSDGKKYTYMGERTAICGIKSHDYEPIEFISPWFKMMRDEEGRAFVPFMGKIEAEVVTRTEADPKPIRSRSEANPKRKGLMRRALDWWKESNRWKHLVYAIPCGVVLGWEFTVGLAVGMEFKDKLWGGKPDFIDYLLTCLGGLIGWGVMRLLGLDYLVMELVKLII
jgi:hypothetical protein